MGFYFEMKSKLATQTTALEYCETQPPPVFWILYLFAGFALTCMALAAHNLLGTLLATGNIWDKLIVMGILSALPIYGFAGLKIGGTRKFIKTVKTNLQIGWQILGFSFVIRTIPLKNIAKFDLVNIKPGRNLAPSQHQDDNYYIRGHWSLMARLQNGESIVLDKHSYREALDEMLSDFEHWHQGATEVS